MVRGLFDRSGIIYKEDTRRGYGKRHLFWHLYPFGTCDLPEYISTTDHGTFVPLKLMFPEADIPVLQLSLVKSLDPEIHIKAGPKWGD